MKKCIACKREILSKASICPYCSAKQNEDEQTKTILLSNEEKDSTQIGESSLDIFHMSEEGIEKTPYISEDKEKEEVSNIPREIIAEEVIDISKEEMIEEAFNILGEESKKTEEEENRILGEKHMENNETKRCSKCKRLIPSKDKYCTYCGTKAEPTPSGNGTGIIREEPKNQGNLLKYYGIVLGVIFGCFAITYLPWLSYYAFSAKLWGFLMVVACAWSAFIYFLIAFRCKRQYGKHLVCALAGGAILKLILQIIMLQQYSVLINSASLSLVAIIITILGVVLCYYLMKSEGMILTQEQKSLQQIITEIPVVLRNIVSQGQTVSGGSSNGNTGGIGIPGTGNRPIPVVPNTLQGKTTYFLSGGLFLTFCILYTLNLAYDIVFNFSYLALIMSIFRILYCVAIWLLYYNSRKNALHTTAFSIITVTTYIKMVLWIALPTLVLIFSIVEQLEIETILGWGVIWLLIFVYWYSLAATFSDAKKFSRGEKGYIKVRIYPIIVKGFSVVGQFIWLMIVASIRDTIDQFRQGIVNFSDYADGLLEGSGSIAEIILAMLDIDPNEYIGKYIEPILQGIEAIFNPISVIVSIAITVIAIILFSKMRSLMKANNS